MTDNLTSSINVDEITALIRYAAESGIDEDVGKVSLLSKLNDAVTEYQNTEEANKHSIKGELVSLYTKLTKLTKPVHGRSLIDTENADKTLRSLGLLTGFLLIVAVSSEVLARWLVEIPVPEEGRLLLLFNIQQYLLEYISPFIWGALGSCVYLLKTLYDIAQERCFDRTKLHGHKLRVLLGAILGAVVLFIFDPSALTTDTMQLTSNAVAFLVGLGVKVVYGAFEKTVEELAKRLNLEGIRKNKLSSPAPVNGQ